MNDASGDNVDEHINAADQNGSTLPKDADNDCDAAHLDPR